MNFCIFLSLFLDNLLLMNQKTEINNFFKTMVNVLERAGKQVGIYTSRSKWIEITKGSRAFATYPLWYAAYDHKKNFSK